MHLFPSPLTFLCLIQCFAGDTKDLGGSPWGLHLVTVRGYVFLVHQEVTVVTAAVSHLPQAKSSPWKGIRVRPRQDVPSYSTQGLAVFLGPFRWCVTFCTPEVYSHVSWVHPRLGFLQRDSSRHSCMLPSAFLFSMEKCFCFKPSQTLMTYYDLTCHLLWKLNFLL